MKNIKETLDYIYLCILKYFKRSSLEILAIEYNNTKSDRLLLEIIKQHKDKFNLINVYCSNEENENLCLNIIGENADKQFAINNSITDYNSLFKLEYKVSSKNELYCNSFLKFNYDNNDLYPLFHYENKEIEEMLKFYNIKLDTLAKEEYGLSNNELEQLNNYLYYYNKFETNLNNKNEYTVKILDLIKQQKALRTKIVPSLTQLQEMKNLL